MLQINNKIRFSFLGLIALILVLKFYNLWYGVDSIFDEGFVLLNIEAPDLSGVSQYNNIINFLLGGKNHELLNLRILRYIVQISSILIFSLASFRFIEFQIGKSLKNEKTIFIGMLMLFAIPSLDSYTTVISYNQLQQFFVLISLSFFLFFESELNKFRKTGLITLAGFFCFFGILNLISSGLILSGAIGVIILFGKNTFFEKLQTLFFFGVGFIVSAVFYHFFVKDLITVYNDLYYSIIRLTTSNRGYDGNSMVGMMYTYLLYVLKISFVYSIISVLYLKFIHSLNTVYKVLFFTVFILLEYYLWQHLYGLLLFPIVFLLIKDGKEIWKLDLRSKGLILIAIFLPVMLSIGTNTDLYSKSLFFIQIWAVLLIWMNYKWLDEKLNVSLLLFFCIVITVANQSFWLVDTKNTNGNFTTSVYQSKRTATISNIGIRKQQLNYFNNVYGILQKYDFKPTDYMLSFQLDHMTIYAMNTKFYGPYFQPMDFLQDPKRYDKPKPKFIFLNTYEYGAVINDLETKSDWDFPKGYDKYYVGTPEIFKTPYSTKRWLYCLKNK